jgi:hypothetical protein
VSNYVLARAAANTDALDELDAVATDGRAYDSALAVCEQLAGDPGTVSQPKGVDRLNAAYHQAVAKVDDELGKPEDYLSCMKDGGFDLSSQDGSGADALFLYLTEMLPVADALPRPGVADSQEWSDFLGMESEALTVDLSCRQTQYVEGWQQLTPALLQFQNVHAAELSQVSAAWQELEQQARDAGFRN